MLSRIIHSPLRDPSVTTLSTAVDEVPLSEDLFLELETSPSNTTNLNLPVTRTTPKRKKKSISVSVPEEVPRKNTTNCAEPIKPGENLRKGGGSNL
jgi:hypothetical protein